MHSFILQTINGISYAALLFLLASGFTLTFGLMRIVNMAHGGLYLFGGYVGLTVAKATGNFAFALLAGGAAAAVLGFISDRFLIRRAGEDHLSQVLITVGLTYIIGDVSLKIWGGDALKLPVPVWLRGVVELPGEIVYPTYRLFLILVGIAVAAGLWLIYRRTQIGAAIRAGVDDREMVRRKRAAATRRFSPITARSSTSAPRM